MGLQLAPSPLLIPQSWPTSIRKELWDRYGILVMAYQLWQISHGILVMADERKELWDPAHVWADTHVCMAAVAAAPFCWVHAHARVRAPSSKLSCMCHVDDCPSSLSRLHDGCAALDGYSTILQTGWPYRLDVHTWWCAVVVESLKL